MKQGIRKYDPGKYFEHLPGRQEDDLCGIARAGKNKKRHINKSVLLCAAFLLSISGFANIRLPSLIGDHMVLQRNKTVTIWGWADPEEQIRVQFQEKQYHTTTNEQGRWQLMLKDLTAGGSFEMQLKGKNTIKIKDILVGDVWVCAGQSNMERKMYQVRDADKEIATARKPSIRLFKVGHNQSTAPLDDVEGKWRVCSPEEVRDYSAIGYFFARGIQPVINVPVGLIDCSYGGTAIEAWISIPGMEGDPVFESEAKALAGFDLDSAVRNSAAAFDQWVTAIEKKDPAYENATYPWSKAAHPDWPEMMLPSIFEDAVPELDAKDGIIWFSKDIVLNRNDIAGAATLSLAIIDDDDLTFVNGTVVGQSRDARTQERRYPIPAGLLKEGTNTITIRVIDYMNNGGIYGKPGSMYLSTPSGKHSLAGSWHYKMSVDTIYPVIYNKVFSPKRKACLLYNAMTAPLTNYAVKGVLWYQGEANANKAYQYRSLFPRMIRDWRTQFREDSLPFLFVQLANYRKAQDNPGNATWAELREAQAMALKLPGTAMVTAVDIGEATDIHPLNKQEVARRLVLQARRMVYGASDLIADGPSFLAYKKEDDHALITFNNVGKGLKTNNGRKVTGFQASADGQHFEWADAVIRDAAHIVVTLPGSREIVAVRYAWADNPEPLNLQNDAGLPALPFRTDQLKGLTYDPRYD